MNLNKIIWSIQVAFTCLVLSAVAQSSVTVTNPAAAIAWDAILTPNVNYDLIITTNKTRITTTGYVPPASAIIAIKPSISGLLWSLTNAWPMMTNGVYSAFVVANDSAGLESPTSTNLVFTVAFPPFPVGGLRIQQ